MNKKKYLLISLLFFSLIFLTACVDGQVDIKMSGDGSADLSYAMVIDKRTYDPLLLEMFLDKLEENLFTVETRDLDEIILVNASVYLPRFRTIFDPTVTLGNEAGKIPVDFKRGWFYSAYDIDVTYDLQKTLDFLKEELDLDQLNFGNMAFSLRLPSPAVSNNADEIKDSEKTYVWNINKEGITSIKLKSKTLNTINFIVAIGVPLLAAFALFNNREKPNKAKSKKK